MSEAWLIFAVEEAEWVSPIVIQRKKGTEDIRVCVDYWSLNSACVHDIFPTRHFPNTLHQWGPRTGCGEGSILIYRWIFRVPPSQDNQIGQRKTTFIIEWGSFAYNVIRFGLKNAPSVFSRIVITDFRYFIHKFIEVYMDDSTIYIFLKEHVALLRLMFDRCREL